MSAALVERNLGVRRWLPNRGSKPQRAIDHPTVGLQPAHQAERGEQRPLDLGDHPLGQDETRAADAPRCLEHCRATPIPALHHLGVAGRSQHQEAPLFAGNQSGEDRFTVEVREAQPDDVTAFVDQGRSAHVAEQPETPDGRAIAHPVTVGRHEVAGSPPTCTQRCTAALMGTRDCWPLGTSAPRRPQRTAASVSTTSATANS